jgi:hypothetical protein
MLAVRTGLALAMIVCGGVILARVLPFGLHFEVLPGIVLGTAMIALGVHRLSLILRMRGGAA